MRKSAPLFCALLLSLSARRAWIEIIYFLALRHIEPVALRKESVDRNQLVIINTSLFFMSLSARRAWIEMDQVIALGDVRAVALRKESVDRNKTQAFGAVRAKGRSPQGERG